LPIRVIYTINIIRGGISDASLALVRPGYKAGIILLAGGRFRLYITDLSKSVINRFNGYAS